MDVLQHWVGQYGYLGIFTLLMLGIAGLPVPDETLLTFTGYLIYRGQLHPLGAFLAACLGSVCGITLSYTLGRLTGYFVIERYGSKLHIGMERVHKVHDWFRRFGRLTLTFGYYVPGVRHLTAYVAGASELEYRPFALFAYAGAFLWSLSFILLGYFLGERWEELSGKVHGWFLLVLCILCVAAAGLYIWHRRRAGAQSDRVKIENR